LAKSLTIKRHPFLSIALCLLHLVGCGDTHLAVSGTPTSSPALYQATPPLSDYRRAITHALRNTRTLPAGTGADTLWDTGQIFTTQLLPSLATEVEWTWTVEPQDPDGSLWTVTFWAIYEQRSAHGTSKILQEGVRYVIDVKTWAATMDLASPGGSRYERLLRAGFPRRWALSGEPPPKGRHQVSPEAPTPDQTRPVCERGR
jgi:hypothetical protein